MNGRRNIVVDTIRFGFRAFIDHVCLFTAILLVGTGISAVVCYFVYLFNVDFIRAIVELGDVESAQRLNALVRAQFPTIIVSTIVSMFIFTGLYLGLNKITLELCDRGKSSVKELFSCFRLAPRVFVALLLFSVMVAGGMLLLVVPGIFIGVRMGLFPYFILDRNAGIIESFKMAYNATRNNGWNLLLLCIAVSIITGIPRLLLSLVGPIGWISFIFSIPFSALVYSFFYRSLVIHQNNRLSDAA